MSYSKAILVVILISVATSLYEGNSPVKLLNEETFEKMLKSKSIWMVEFFSPQCGHCVQAAPEYEKAAKILEGIVFYGAVDMLKYPSLGGKYNIRGYPTFKLFADNKNSPLDYGSQRSAQEFVQWTLTQTKQVINARANGGQAKSKKGSSNKGGSGNKGGSKDSGNSQVIVLDDKNFEEKVLKSEEAWFVQFYSPSCGHCISLQPQWEKLPGIMKDKVRIAKIDATVNRGMASKYQIKGFPTLILFPQGSKSQKVNYEGARSAEQMASWLNSQKIGQEKRQFLQLSQSTFDTQCQKNNVCLLFLLDNKSDLKQLKYLNTIIQAHKKQPVHYLYTTQRLNELQNDLIISDRSYPKMIVVSTSMNSYKIYNGQLNQKDTQEFVSKLFGKRGWIKFSKKFDKYLAPNTEL